VKFCRPSEPPAVAGGRLWVAKPRAVSVDTGHYIPNQVNRKKIWRLAVL
jgi:hypothetical protein